MVGIINKRIPDDEGSVDIEPADIGSTAAVDEMEDTDVNSTGVEEDESPIVHSATVMHNGRHTDVIVRIASANGWQNKRIVIPRHLTARSLATALLNVANW